ncbi:MAG: chemotaxis protein CheX [Armatimonadetes bacterium]|nr:chemotaxis protein CheX [Armatimonadota bacterium]MDW8028305.1 chemotaxis protein CheX [Armatimonadota bacterium]
MLEVQNLKQKSSAFNGIADWYAEVANPILRAASEALEGLIGLKVERGKPSLRLSAYTEEDITVAISVEGDLKGVILLGFNYRTAFRMLQKMLGEELNTNLPISDFLKESELARSALQEIANILSGRSAMHLEASGKNCIISPPELLMRRGVLLSERDFQQLVIPIKTDVGNLELSIALFPNGNGSGQGREVFVAQQIIQPRRSIVRYDFANPEHLGRTVYSNLQQVHERFQQVLAQKVGIRMRIGLRLSKASLEKDTFAHFLQRDYQWSVAGIFNLDMSNTPWIMAISQSVALLLVDRWLGGPGKLAQVERKDWTPLERGALSRIMELLGDAYAETWQQQTGLKVSLRLLQVSTGDLSEQSVSFQSVGAALLVSHRLQVGDEIGVLQWILIADSLSSLLSKPSIVSGTEAVLNSPISPSIRLKLHLGWKCPSITAKQLQNLKVGTILMLHSPLLIWCKGKVIGLGEPYRKNGRIVAKIAKYMGLNKISLSHPDDKSDEGAERAKS